MTRYRTTKPCPGCGAGYEWSAEQIVPSNRLLGEPDGVGIRYLMSDPRGKPVHKCPAPVEAPDPTQLRGVLAATKERTE